MTASARLTRAQLEERAERALAGLAACTVCPRRCGVNRLAGETGACGGGREARVASYNVHQGEEPPISGTRGSGTLFFSGCPLRCLFCQNYPISQQRAGRDATARELAAMMIFLQEKGCHNINLVTGTHFVPQFLAALALAVRDGFNLPLVYNTSGYETPATLELLEGVIDIYLPDLKYADDQAGRDISGANDYFTHASAALSAMNRRAGPLTGAPDGTAVSGLLVRHLVLPGGLSTTEGVLRFIARELSPETHLSLMSQYFPAHRATGHPLLGRRVRRREYLEAVELAQSLGMENVFIQEIPGR